MDYTIHKLTFSEGRAYRYEMADREGQVRYLAEPTGLTLPNPTRQITLFDADHQPLARLEPVVTSPWRWTRVYALMLEGEESGSVTIEERWTLVDRILLRLPTYTLRIGSHVYTARGQRYGEVFYELFGPRPETPEGTDTASEPEPAGRERVGEVIRSSVGPNYLISAEAAPLRQAPLALAAFVVLADLHLYR